MVASVDVVRCRAGISGHPPRAPAEQSRGAMSVTPPRMREAHRDLGEPLPQVPLGGRRGLPRRFEHLVRMERAALVEQLLGER